MAPTIGCFNPRSRMGSDLRFCPNIIFSLVSIHAPAWGATLERLKQLKQDMFQSTLPHGERHWAYSRILRIRCFNPRSRMGSDTRGKIKNRHCEGFNPRSHMGSDRKSSAYCSLLHCFNPRSHMGSDPRTAQYRRSCLGFNPRSHMGSDPL